MQINIKFLFHYIDSFFYLFKEVKGVKSSLRLTLYPLFNFLFPGFFRLFPITSEVRFANFYLRFRVGKSELGSYSENKTAFYSIFQFYPDRNNWVIIDCGANIGVFSLFFKNAKKIIAVEANNNCYEELRYNFNRNKVRGIIINKAVSFNACDVKMNIDNSVTVLSRVCATGNVTVKATTIDQIIIDNALEQVDLLKLDLEGYELKALMGAKDSLSKGIIKRIYLECLDRKSLDDIQEYLKPFIFRRVAEIRCNFLYEFQD